MPLRNSAAVNKVWSIFDGFERWALPTAKVGTVAVSLQLKIVPCQVCQVGWSGPHQGFEAHVERYRNSPVMHRSALPHIP